MKLHFRLYLLPFEAESSSDLHLFFFFHQHSRVTELLGKGERISFTPHYHFNALHRHLDSSRAITAESSPLHIASSGTRTGSLIFPSTCR